MRPLPIVSCAVLWRKRQNRHGADNRETKPALRNFTYMMLAMTGAITGAVTGEWVAEVTLVLCLFGATCIWLAASLGDGGAKRRAAEQNPVKQKSSAARRAARRRPD
jgi:hypothetical protein